MSAFILQSEHTQLALLCSLYRPITVAGASVLVSAVTPKTSQTTCKLAEWAIDEERVNVESGRDCREHQLAPTGDADDAAAVECFDAFRISFMKLSRLL